MNNIAKRGIYLSAGQVKAANITVKNTKAEGIYMENVGSLEATNLTVQNVEHQGIQIQHQGTLKVTGTLTLDNITKNALRLYNRNGQPTVTIGTLKTTTVGEYGIAATLTITNTNLNVTKMLHKNCTTVLHGNVDAGCVGTIQEITE